MSAYELPRLRGVEKSDLDMIAELEAEAFGSNSLTRSALGVIYDPSGAFWLLAEDDEGVWGHTVNVRGEDPYVGWILGMAVHPLRQNRGWGPALLQATIDRLHDFDMEVIRLVVNPSNRIARRLYESFGFLDTGERLDHFGPGEARMVLSLLNRVPARRAPGLVPQIPCDGDQTLNS